MKKLILTIALLFAVCGAANAAIAPVAVPPPAVVAGSSALPNFWLFTGALGFAGLVEYLDAEGVENPLCGLGKCFDEYPVAVHRDGV
jgi:hypothetical protein